VAALTLRTLLKDSEQRLKRAKVSYGHGTTNARDEAAWLALHALKLSYEALETRLDAPLAGAQIERVRALIEERIRTRKPAAYLTQQAWLGDYAFYVDERTIVPRSFIAELMRDGLAPWVSRPARVKSVLDLCTGSGCLAVLAALTYRNANVEGADISADALAVARRNVADYSLAKRVKLVESDLYRSLAERRYDLILSNPPYVTDAAMSRLPVEYRKEPALALAGGRDGLDLVRAIVAEAPDHLTESGLLVVEVGHARKRVERVFADLPLVWPQTSGGDDCVFAITRQALLSARRPREALPVARARAPRATRAAPSPRAPQAGSPGRASGAAAKRPRRSARGSGGSR
jgi:ribosomal protein L3 glutamine methyltransferase